jgi:hypothetical protein
VLAKIDGMILLIWSSDRVSDCAKAIEHSFQQPVCIVSTLQRGCEQLQSQPFSAVLLDQGLAEAEPGQADFLFHHLGTAVPVLVNFAISGVERVLRELRAALNRRLRDTMLARLDARRELLSELKDDVTGLLLCCGVALEQANLPEGAAERVRKIEEIANRIRDRLLATNGAENRMATTA